MEVCEIVSRDIIYFVLYVSDQKVWHYVDTLPRWYPGAKQAGRGLGVGTQYSYKKVWKSYAWSIGSSEWSWNGTDKGKRWVWDIHMISCRRHFGTV